MVAFLIVVGAVVVFAAGWLAARTLSDDSPGPTAGESPRGEPRYDDVLDRHPVGIVVAGASGAVEYRNPAARDLAGTHVGALVDGAVDEQLRAACAGARGDDTLDLFGPPRRVVHIVTEPLAGGRAVAFVSDITERRRTDQMRTDFVANVSHELRTPIGALMVLAEALGDSGQPDEVERIVERMISESERASRTIDDLLELSSLEAAVSHDAAPIALCDVARDAITRAAELASSNDIAITGPPDMPDGGPVVLGDRRQLASAVGNLVENAVKYSDPGDHVRVTVRSDASVGEIAVIDEGAGIPRRDLDRVFERFYRVDRARSRLTGGTGLGLSIVRHVAHAHRGSVDVESVEGEGTTFVLRIPLIDDGAPSQAEAPTLDGVDEASG